MKETSPACVKSIEESYSMQKNILFLWITAALVLASCNAPNAETVPPANLTRIPTQVITATASQLAPTAAPTDEPQETSNYNTPTMGIAFDYPSTWIVSEALPGEPNGILLTSYDPTSPPHKLEWDDQTVSINIRQISPESVPQDLDSWVEGNKQEAIADLLEVFLDERLMLGGQLPAAHLRLVSGSGGIIDQVFTYVGGHPYEISIQGNFELARIVLDTLHASLSLKPADSQELVSGICGSMEGEIVEITITADGPAMPRCVRVTSGQRLKFINSKGVDLRTGFSQYTVSIPSGGELLLDQPVGEFLAPGVHYFEGAEIYLANPDPAPPSPPSHNQFFNTEAGYTITFPSDWLLNDYGLTQPNKEIIINPVEAEPFITYVSILIDPRSMEEIHRLYAESVPDAQRSEVTFAGMHSVQYRYSWGRIEIYIPYQGRIYLASSDRPDLPEVKSILDSITFQN